MTSTISVSTVLSQFWAADDALTIRATKIINECRSIMNITQDADSQKELRAIIQQTQTLLGKKFIADEVNREKTLKACQDLLGSVFNLPPKVPAGISFAEINYKIFLACAYILMLSVSLAVGATFGAWYFDILTASTFTNSLVTAFASIGIPAILIGCFSYGTYSVYKNPIEARVSELTLQVEGFCKEILKKVDIVVPEVAPSQFENTHVV